MLSSILFGFLCVYSSRYEPDFLCSAEIALWILQQALQLFGTNRFDGRTFLHRTMLRYMDEIFVIAFSGALIERKQQSRSSFVTKGSDCVRTNNYISITHLSIPRHAQLHRHRLKFIKTHLKIPTCFGLRPSSGSYNVLAKITII